MTFHPDSDLRALRGDATRDRAIYSEGPHAPWQATAVVTPVRLGRWQFEVRARWEGGPPTYGSPEQPGMPPPTVSEDLILVEDRDLAVAIAKAAGDLLRAAHRPDLLALKRALQRPK